MTFNSQNLSSNRKSKTFNNPERFIEGWYWAIPTDDLRVGEVKAITLLGRDLVIYRGKDRKAVTFDAYCPHMGAHLADGKIENNGLRCSFHQWKFDREGFCIDIPCLDETLPLKLKAWPTAEKYGMIWVWTGEVPLQPLPFIPELEAQDFDVTIISQFVSNCHPHALIINAIDTQYFQTFKRIPAENIFDTQELNQHAITFTNNTQGRKGNFLGKLIRPFYKNDLNYSVCYWYGSTSMITFIPNSMHVHVMFTLRLIAGGKTEGYTLLIMKKRQRTLGKFYNRIVLALGKILSQDFLKVDAQILEKIKFDLRTPVKTDQAIMQFINHLERQPALSWGTWQQARTSRDSETRDNRDKWRDDFND
ncbi:Rieske [2Fe-2S] domain-containing protein [Calothrix brevissima NIES-22]|nr:Rieske [2Fe-2S] domain-containing protein [Calothrix brevissima NIES-22]